MNKRLVFLLVLLFLCVALISADNVIWGSNYEAGNVSLGLDFGFEVGPNIEISAYPSAEMILFKPVFEDVAPLDLGVKLLGRFGVALLSPGIDLGVGAAGTVHLGFKDMDIPDLNEYLDPLDFFAEVGVCFDFIRTSTSFVGLVVNSGFNYWLSDDMAVGLKYTSWNQYYGGAASILLKFGDQSAAEKSVEKAVSE